jgi:hypothetical protein
MNNPTASNVINADLIEKAIDYQTYRNLIDDLLAQGKTTGPNQNQFLTDYTKMNVQRMNRWDKTAVLKDDLKAEVQQLQGKWIWLVLTEGWCGDAAQNIPTIVKIAQLNANIELKFLLRDENLALMDQYLTNGGRAIPKLIALKSATLEEVGTWGPRPQVLQAWVTAERKKPDFDFKPFSEKVHKWYADNKTQDLQAEFLELIKSMKA